MFSRCTYCHNILLIKRYKFENELICKSCLKIVPKWTMSLRKELDNLKEGS